MLGSTSNFDFPPEELDQFAKDHNLNGGSASSATEDDDDDYTESLVYVSSPKVWFCLACLLSGQNDCFGYSHSVVHWTAVQALTVSAV